VFNGRVGVAGSWALPIYGIDVVKRHDGIHGQPTVHHEDLAMKTDEVLGTPWRSRDMGKSAGNL
jgi:hypothetical protein